MKPAVKASVMQLEQDEDCGRGFSSVLSHGLGSRSQSHGVGCVNNCAIKITVAINCGLLPQLRDNVHACSKMAKIIGFVIQFQFFSNREERCGRNWQNVDVGER